MDEVPYLSERVDAFEGILQRAWDRELSRKPVLLVLVGSDLSMMVALQRHRSALTDEPLPLLAVSRSGVSAGGLAAAYGPQDLIRAWG